MSTIADIQDMPDEVQLESPLTGRIKMVFQGKTGEHGFGQAIIVADDTGEIKIMLNQRDPIPDTARGQTITVGSFKGVKGLMGCKVASYNGTKQLKMTKNGDVVFGGSTTLAPNRQPIQQPSVKTPVQASYMAQASTNKDQTILFQTLSKIYWDGSFKNDKSNTKSWELFLAWALEGKATHDEFICPKVKSSPIVEKAKEVFEAVEVSHEDDPFSQE